MIERVDADDRVKGLVGERKPAAGVVLQELNAILQAKPVHLQICRGDPVGVDVDSRDVASG